MVRVPFACAPYSLLPTGNCLLFLVDVLLSPERQMGKLFGGLAPKYSFGNPLVQKTVVFRSWLVIPVATHLRRDASQKEDKEGFVDL